VEITTTNCGVDHSTFFEGAPLQKQLMSLAKNITKTVEKLRQ
jgi:hypothetical protein